MSAAGNPFFLSEVAGGGQGAANARIVQPEPSAGNFTTRADFGTVTTARWYRLTPAATVGPAGGDTATTPPTTGDNVGWNIPAADMDRPSGRPRKMFGGTVTFNVTVIWTDLDPLAGAGTWKARAHLFKRGTIGTLTLLGSGEVSIGAADVGTLEKSYSFTATVAETLFATGETLHVEYWLRGRGTTLGQTFQLRTGNAATDVKVTLPGAGLVHQTALEGYTRDATGTGLAATVKIFNQATDAKATEQVSAADGRYSWVRDSTDTNTYYVVAYKTGTPEIHGMSDRGLVPAE
jgi:hypothetical protein